MLTHNETQQWAELAALIKSAAAEPSIAAQTMGRAAKLARLVDVGMRRNHTAQKIMGAVFPSSGNAVVVTAGVPVPITLSVSWPQNYHVIGVKAYSVGGINELQHLNMSLALNDGTPFFVNQNGAPAFIDFQTLQGTPGQPFLSFYPLDEYAKAQTPWTLTVSSTDTTGNATYIPLVSFLVEAWDIGLDPRP